MLEKVSGCFKIYVFFMCLFVCPPLQACEPKTSFGASFRLGGSPRLRRTHCSPNMAAREKIRVRELRQAFNSLQVAPRSLYVTDRQRGQDSNCVCVCPQAALPSVPPDTKLSKIDVLVLATNYIAHLMEILNHPGGGPVTHHAMLTRPAGHLQPLKVGCHQSHSLCAWQGYKGWKVKGQGSLSLSLSLSRLRSGQCVLCSTVAAMAKCCGEC